MGESLEDAMKKQNEERFVLLEDEGSVIMGTGRVLLMDRETGVTPLIDADGKPILTKLPEEK